MPCARTNDVELYYESQGTGEPLLLIAGIGSPCFYWPDGLCDLLVGRGFRVIRFDSRDVGRSTKLDKARAAALVPSVLRYALGLPVNAPYTLSDMACDAVGLLDVLGIDCAHVAGLSLGGAVAQTMAVHHPARIRSLCSISSTTGARRHGLWVLHGLVALLTPAPANAEKAAQRSLWGNKTLGSKGFPIDEEAVKERARQSFVYDPTPDGMVRQFMALIEGGNRAAELARVRCPTLVIHGDCDGLIPAAAGRATKRAIPGAKLRVIKGLGHDTPAAAWPILVDAIAGHAHARPCVAEATGARDAQIAS